MKDPATQPRRVLVDATKKMATKLHRREVGTAAASGWASPGAIDVPVSTTGWYAAGIRHAASTSSRCMRRSSEPLHTLPEGCPAAQPGDVRGLLAGPRTDGPVR